MTHNSLLLSWISLIHYLWETTIIILVFLEELNTLVLDRLINEDVRFSQTETFNDESCEPHASWFLWLSGTKRAVRLVSVSISQLSHVS